MCDRYREALKRAAKDKWSQTNCCPLFIIPGYKELMDSGISCYCYRNVQRKESMANPDNASKNDYCRQTLKCWQAHWLNEQFICMQSGD